MQNKLNPKIVLALAFCFAALDSSLATLLCMGALYFLNRSDKDALVSCGEAVALSIASPLVNTGLGIIRTILGLIPSNPVISAILSLVGLAGSLVGYGVFVIGLVAAMNIAKGGKAKIPFISGKMGALFIQE